jgi:hypothetical protein
MSDDVAPNPYLVAIHEAGHVVVADRLGLRVRRVKLEDGGGGAYWLRGPWPDNPEILLREAQTLLAGPLAETKVRPLSAEERLEAWHYGHWQVDRSNALHAICKALYCDADAEHRSTSRTLTRLFKRTNKLVLEHWDAITTVAEALVDRRILTGAEVERLIAWSQ